MSSDTVDSWVDALGSKDVMEQIAAKDKLIKSGDPRAVSQLLSKVASDEGWAGKVNAGIVIHQLGTRAVEPLLQVLGRGETKQKSLAAEMLGIIRDAKAVDPLIEALKDAEATVRGRSALALGVLGDARAFDSLLQALADKDKSVRSNAGAALGQLRDPRAFEPLLGALQSNSLAGAALGLGQLGDKRALPSLIAGLRSEDKDMRRCASIGLGQLGDGSAVEQLITALGDQEASVRQGAALALGKLRDTRASEPLCRLLQDSDRTVRWRAAQALGDVGDAGAVEPLSKALNDEASLVKLSAEEALKKVKQRTVFAPRSDNVMDSPVGKVTAPHSGRSPGRKRFLGGIRAWWILRKLRAERIGTSESYVSALSECGLAAVPQLITALAAYHPHELSDSLKPKVAGTFDVSIDHDRCKSYAALRQCAAAALGVIGDVRAIEPLKVLLYSERKRQLCRSLAHGDLFKLAGLNHSESADILCAAATAISGLQSEDPELQRACRKTAGAVLIGAFGFAAFEGDIYSDTDRKKIIAALCKALKRLSLDRWTVLHEWEDVYRVDDGLAYVPLRVALQEIDYLSPLAEWHQKEGWAQVVGNIAERLETIGNPVPLDALEKVLVRLTQLPNELSGRIEADARETTGVRGMLARVLQKTNVNEPQDTYYVDSAIASVKRAIEALKRSRSGGG